MSRTLLVLAAERSRRDAVESLCQEYLRRLQRYKLRASIEECSNSFAGTIERTLDTQAAQLLRRVTSNDYVVLLDQQGTAWSSEQLARWLQQRMDQTKRLVFIIGGAYGVGAAVRQRADQVLSLGPLTLPHELARIVLCEQLYRAMTIIHGEPYHHGSTDE